MTAAQLDLFAVAAPVAKAVAHATPPAARVEGQSANGGTAVRRGRATHPIHASDERDYWQTRAWSWGGEILVSSEREPVEIVVRGIPCVVSFGICTCTHAIDPPGTPFWSETGFRSFGGFLGRDHDTRTPAELVAMIEAYIDAKPGGDGAGGLGGKLDRWWTCEVREWLQHGRFMKRIKPDFWNHKGEDEGARIYAEQQAKVATLLARVIALGLDPRDIAPDLAPRQAALL